MSCKPILSMDEFQEHLKTLKSVPKYDSSAEEKIPHPWWELDKISINSLLKDISELVATCTQGAIGLDKELQHVANTATKLEQVECGTTVKVALIGAQGAGKSLLINALFDCTGLSLTGAKGFACTSAIVRYAYGQGDKYSAEVRFLNAKMREQMIDEHIRSFLDYHNDLADSDDEDGGRRTRSFKQDEIDRKRKKTAEDFFDTIFGSRDEFLCAWSSSPVNTGEFKSLCQLKCKEAMNEYDMTSQGATLFSKSNPADLLKEIKPFLSNVDDEVCLWPIVDCVTIRLNHPLLREGLEIVDLPGSGDVNMLRARHAEDVKDTVDVEIILGDTVRIGTDDMVMSTARAGILNHGASKVKVIATKIDMLSDDQLAQCCGGVYDEVKVLMAKADEDAAAADEENEDARVAQINRYKQYLQRYLKAQMIGDRATDISNKLGATLQGFSSDGAVEIIHTSTADYMVWIKSDKISFNNQPALSPEETGVPIIRRFLYNLPASQNYRDYTNHIDMTVPAFVDKLKRVVSHSDRDAGFRTIADDFDDLRSRFIREMILSLKNAYQSYLKISVNKIKRDTNAYKEAVKTRIQKHWLPLRSPAFTRLLKSRGTVPQGTSKARGLENTVNWNAELASIVRPGFQKWYASHTENMKLLKDALPLQLDRLYHETALLMNKSQANLITVEKSKLKWSPYRHRLQSKLMAMLEEMFAEEQRFLHRATLKDERENNMIAALTDNIYDDVFMSTPELKVNPTPPGKAKRYVTPVFRFRKDRLETHFLHAEAHFVDRLVVLFQSQLREKMEGLIDKHFTKIKAMLDDFSKLLRDHAPVDFSIDSRGEAIRAELELQIPYVEEKAEALHSILPIDLSERDETMLATEDNYDDGNQDLSYYIEKVSKGKRKNGHTSPATVKRESGPKTKQIKHEAA
ncbi:hypothetical protein CC86DRAFT_432039 [Ophiobolus disseminans]|uniref:P-loop containing nucleoside triphosphate hydrolase protein n=1 Tax=Ophiobolus disseminans TaxID=1469910 RepID=A0A6A6ZFF4_9PLEO|nr:hypothetical protein CC86DRAFT_432039 [Ophiobolus disseminans]